MSILSKLKQQKEEGDKKLFGVVAGLRLAGKTSLAGTLPGKTLMIQASVLESGSRSAEEIAKNNGYELDVITFHSLPELLEVLAELKEDTEYDNVYVDGLSAITELKAKDPDTAKLMKKNVWDGFRDVGDFANDVVVALKSLTYTGQATKPKHVFITCALKLKQDKMGNVIDVELETKGNMAVTSITKLGECVVTVLQVTTEEGPKRQLITRTLDFWPGRIDGVLDSNNPGQIEANLATLLNLREGNNE